MFPPLDLDISVSTTSSFTLKDSPKCSLLSKFLRSDCHFKNTVCRCSKKLVNFALLYTSLLFQIYNPNVSSFTKTSTTTLTLDNFKWIYHKKALRIFLSWQWIPQFILPTCKLSNYGFFPNESIGNSFFLMYIKFHHKNHQFTFWILRHQVKLVKLMTMTRVELQSY